MISIIGVPYDGNSSFLRGAAAAPEAIRHSLFCPSSNLWAENGIDLEPLLKDAGDVKFESASDFAPKIEAALASLYSADQIPIALGGDHSISFPILKAVHEKHSQVSILHLDAHSDSYERFDDNYYSHASPFARIMESELAKQLVQVGIRTLNEHQRDQVRRYGIELHEAKDWRDGTVLRFKYPLYISIDLDVLDPAFAPGVSHQEAGGFSTRQIVQIIQTLEAPSIIGADIVELNPSRDASGITARAASKILKELAARIVAEQQPTIARAERHDQGAAN